MSTSHVTLFEVGPRDGLQNIKTFVPTAEKVALVDALSRTGLRKIEAASFVSPRWVPQMADGTEVMAGIARVPGVAMAALTPNLKGYEAAKAARVDEVAVFASASEGFSRANLNCSIAESLERFHPLMEQARADGMPVRGYLSCAIACPYDGTTAPAAVAKVAEMLLEMGCYEISLGDTIGAGTAATLSALLDVVLSRIPADRLAGHFHDTNATALEMIEASLARGLRVFDASVGGLGGCPYAPGARGNVDTLAALERIEALGFSCGINPLEMQKATRLAARLGKGS
ncbi:hydroxymethylglutaryl-CoA lyase [Stappia sp. ES.058]|uniref:hydroxymethylglutaryl-CoA lyase n=1 Tax=Stappia sp. ES.058 TaxID=1881061 RepID=UPI00087B29C3|nr:hydroxymethylglutaryl-CoA lyase [Stappia sp. ES.058]SDU01702.1 hydroxymethylglutaryl-CoA lyase [Stappia sp. ES.058]